MNYEPPGANEYVELGATQPPARVAGVPRAARIAVFIAGGAFALTPWASPGLALALGMTLALTLDNPLRQVSSVGSKYILQSSVVLLGFGMNLKIVLAAGQRGLLFAAGTILFTFALGAALAKWLRINRITSLLICAGTAICGGSAIAAVGSSVDADHGEMTVAMGTVFLLNAVALYTFPAIGHALGMSQTEFGTWAGVAIHDISSVVGAAASYGHEALQTATAVKLSRALWILPLTTVTGFLYHRHHAPSAGALAPAPTGVTAPGKRKLHVPWFIGLFLLASVVRNFSPRVAAIAPLLDHLAEVGMTLALFLIGANLSRATLKAVGIKPLLQGVILWIAISASSIFVIMNTVH